MEETNESSTHRRTWTAKQTTVGTLAPGSDGVMGLMNQRSPTR